MEASAVCQAVGGHRPVYYDSMWVNLGGARGRHVDWHFLGGPDLDSQRKNFFMAAGGMADSPGSGGGMVGTGSSNLGLEQGKG